jgi:hypothetical protein
MIRMIKIINNMHAIVTPTIEPVFNAAAVVVSVDMMSLRLNSIQSSNNIGMECEIYSLSQAFLSVDHFIQTEPSKKNFAIVATAELEDSDVEETLLKIYS